MRVIVTVRPSINWYVFLYTFCFFPFISVSSTITFEFTASDGASGSDYMLNSYAGCYIEGFLFLSEEVLA